MSPEQSGQEGLAGTIVVSIVPSASTPPLFTEAHNFEQTFLGPFKIPGDIA